MKRFQFCKILLGLLCCCLTHSIVAAATFEDSFDSFNQDNWTKQFSGMRLAEEPFPPGVTINNSICTLDEPLQGLRFTSRQKFLYGTLETKVKIKPRGLQYIGFMSRQPWGANTVFCMSLPDGSGWRLLLASNTPSKGVGVEINQGADVGIAVNVPENDWCTLKIVWTKEKVEFYANGELKGTVTDQSLIPQSPAPLILDQIALCPMEVDYLKVSDTQIFTDETGQPPVATEKGPTQTLKSSEWKVVINKSTGLIHQVYGMQPKELLLTPENIAGIDLYVRTIPDGQPVRFGQSEKACSKANSFECALTPIEPNCRQLVKANYSVKLEGDQLRIDAKFTSLKDINYPVEIGVGLPFKPDQWERQIFARCPWLALSLEQNNQLRFPFLSDPNDATVASSAGNWIFYPMGLLDSKDRMVFWGNMDIGKRIVLAPNNYGSLPAVTLAPKSWPKGVTKTLSFTVKSFSKPQNGLPQALKWYLSNCTSSDPLTSDLFPIRDWSPRVFAKGGGVGMPPVAATHINPNEDVKKSFDQLTELMLKYSIPSLWLGTFNKVDGSYPTSGEWYSTQYFFISAEKWRDEVQRLKQTGLRPCLYVNQFIYPELLRDGGVPDKRWILHGTDGVLSAFDSYAAGQGGFTKEIAEKIGTNRLTMADGDFGNNDFRKWYTEQVKAVVDYYQPSGISFDFGWSIMGPYAAWSPSNPSTSLPHGRLRMQADIRKWMKKKYPQMQIIANCIPGSPTEFFVDCMLLESTQSMSDVDFSAGKALGSAMSSMDYFQDHDQKRWTRQMMLDLARGCSFGAPSWIITTPPESNYIATWKKFLDFSGKTTRLPLTPREDAIISLGENKDIAGTVWSNGKEVMAAALDRRLNGNTINSAFSIMIPKKIGAGVKWKLSHLNSLNVEIPESGWSVKEAKKGRLIISGPLASGEMILIESIK
ncbi:MAG: LamG domain-containing protein [Sedimentisphaerales bacterium]